MTTTTTKTGQVICQFIHTAQLVAELLSFVEKKRKFLAQATLTITVIAQNERSI